MHDFNLYTVHVTVAAFSDVTGSKGITDRLFEVYATNNSDAIRFAHDWIMDRHPDWDIVATPFVYRVGHVDDEQEGLTLLAIKYDGISTWPRCLPEGQKAISVKLNRTIEWGDVAAVLTDMHDVSEHAVEQMMKDNTVLEGDEVLDPEDMEFENGYDIEESPLAFVAVDWNAQRLSIEDCRADAYEWLEERNGFTECFAVFAHAPGVQPGVQGVIEPRQEK